MATLSLAMIVKNEERTLGRVLEAARQFCDEMIVVDTGSTDGTVALAESLGATVHHFPWIDDFAAARNFSFSKATGDWIIWLDADDEIRPEMIEKFQYVKENYLQPGQADVNAFMVQYNYAHDKHEAKELRKLVIGLNRERIIRRACGFKWEGRVHETINLNGEPRIGKLDGLEVDHDTAPENEPRRTGRNLRIYEQYIDTETCTLHDLFQYGGELQADAQYTPAIAVYDKYLARHGEGLRDNMGERYSVLIKRAECRRVLKAYPEATKAALDAVCEDPTRAEAFGILGMNHYEQGNFAAAFPMFLAAAACKPPKHGGLVFAAFYGEAVHDLIKDCKEKLTAKVDTATVSG